MLNAFLNGDYILNVFLSDVIYFSLVMNEYKPVTCLEFSETCRKSILYFVFHSLPQTTRLLGGVNQSIFDPINQCLEKVQIGLLYYSHS